MSSLHDAVAAASVRQRDDLRRMDPGTRLAIAAALSDDVRALALAGIRARRPASTEAQIMDELARIVLGRRLAAVVEPARADPAQ
jgi:hypothetical protein